MSSHSSVWPTSRWKTERSVWQRAAGVSNSTTFPACNTSTRSLSMMVLILAMHKCRQILKTKEHDGGGAAAGVTDTFSLFGSMSWLSPVCDGEDGLVLELLPDGLLQQLVGLLVHAGSGFINTQELRSGGKHSVKYWCCDSELRVRRRTQSTLNFYDQRNQIIFIALVAQQENWLKLT